ncbi:hypothetical protein PC129_g8957 [Phytophthora cactorum]|nr:hypothetical protein Pcac1_g9069 [Phytophthora cactorum]KAG2825068.1 hypothetical protein PC111_g9546 [Phytophthora cactorum]KAG2856618.1 hypothetical protein PC113_g11418 [Phytophthora cactorum]KAG2919351.1 hypothetical protein PC115_g10178 [Phytophthora cactorum]KAG2937715.1 hypothetical protein PC117_g11577 [Phytophthora cactorum]
MIDDAARDGAHAPTPTLAADRERIGIANDTEVKSNAVARERGDGTTDDQVLAVDNDQALEMLMIMRGLAGRLERLEQSQSKLEKKLDDEEKRVRAVDPPMTLKPLRVGLGCGARTHIDSLARSPQTPLMTTPRRPAVPPQYFGQHQPGYGVPLSELQRLFAAAQGAQHARPGSAATRSTRLRWRWRLSGATMSADALSGCTPEEARDSPFRWKRIVCRTRIGVLCVGPVLERHVQLSQSACGFWWPEDVKVALLGHYLFGTAERYYNKQAESWWAQLPTSQYVMGRMLKAFKTNITPAQTMKLFTAPKDGRPKWPEHYLSLVAVSEACGGGVDYLVLNNIVQYASADLRTVLMAKVDAARTDYLQQAEELAHFAQSWELEPTRQRNLGKEVVSAVSDSRGTETRSCHECGEIGHLHTACSNRVRGRGREAGLTLDVHKA